ncbi:MAG: hypothetical protein HQL26_02235 [Candidatus Omnitrophica bacterium]|nr:hypothetical protein [Candidatus Omnitrophota bacterium]
MEIENKFCNIVVLGNFNPAILTHEFLVDICKIDLEKPINLQLTPIHSQIKYQKNNISFLTSLDRFEISELKPEVFENSIIPKCANSYLNVLKYTPMVLCGVNFQIDAKNVDLVNLQNSFVKQGIELKKFLKAKNVTNRHSIDIDEANKEQYVGYDVKFTLRDGISGNIRVKVLGEKNINLNYNFEVSLENKDNLKLILADYYQRAVEFKDFINHFIKG